MEENKSIKREGSLSKLTRKASKMLFGDNKDDLDDIKDENNSSDDNSSDDSSDTDSDLNPDALLQQLNKISKKFLLDDNNNNNNNNTEKNENKKRKKNRQKNKKKIYYHDMDLDSDEYESNDDDDDDDESFDSDDSTDNSYESDNDNNNNNINVKIDIDKNNNKRKNIKKNRLRKDSKSNISPHNSFHENLAPSPHSPHSPHSTNSFRIDSPLNVNFIEKDIKEIAKKSEKLRSGSRYVPESSFNNDSSSIFSPKINTKKINQNENQVELIINNNDNKNNHKEEEEEEEEEEEKERKKNNQNKDEAVLDNFVKGVNDLIFGKDIELSQKQLIERAESAKAGRKNRDARKSNRNAPLKIPLAPETIEKKPSGLNLRRPSFIARKLSEDKKRKDKALITKEERYDDFIRRLEKGFPMIKFSRNLKQKLARVIYSHNDGKYINWRHPDREENLSIPKHVLRQAVNQKPPLKIQELMIVKKLKDNDNLDYIHLVFKSRPLDIQVENQGLLDEIYWGFLELRRRYSPFEHGRGSKDLRELRPTTLKELYKVRQYKPLILKYKFLNKEREINIGCGNSLEDIGIIICCLITLWSTIVGIFALLLKAALDTDDSNTALWIYFFIGLIFISLWTLAIYTGQNERERRLLQEEEDEEDEDDEINFNDSEIIF